MGNGIWSKVSEGWNLQMKFWYWRAHCSLSLNSFLYLLWHAEWVLFVSNVPYFVNFLQWNQECYEKSWRKFHGCQEFFWKWINLYKFSFTSITIFKSWRFTSQFIHISRECGNHPSQYIFNTHFKDWFDWDPEFPYLIFYVCLFYSPYLSTYLAPYGIYPAMKMKSCEWILNTWAPETFEKKKNIERQFY